MKTHRLELENGKPAVRRIAAAPSVTSDARSWARLAVVCGFVAGGTYTLLSAIELPLLLTLILVCAFGPALAAHSAGLYEVLRIHRSTISLKLGLGTNVAAAIAVTLMFLAQIGYRELLELEFGASSAAGAGSPAYQAANGIQLGLDMSWDLFFALGTFLLASNMWRHPRFGPAYGITGQIITIGLLVLNLLAFPVPPADSHLVDLGPVLGLWYVAVTIRLATSLEWVANAQHKGSRSSAPSDPGISSPPRRS